MERMLKLRKVAITGGLSCGKSSVCRFFKELGAYVISSDDIVHHLLSTDANLGQEIIKLLGTGVIANQKLDRSRIAQIVFHDFTLLKALENILHPAVYHEIEKKYQQQANQNHPPPLFIAEVPLLFESDGEKYFDYTVVVKANPEVCAERYQKSSGHALQEFEKRMSRQLPTSEKAGRADYVIENNGSLEELKQNTVELFQKLTQ